LYQHAPVSLRGTDVDERRILDAVLSSFARVVVGVPQVNLPAAGFQQDLLGIA
jgi:hypothetical protein